MKRSTLEKLREISKKYNEKSNCNTYEGFFNVGISEGIGKAIMVLIENEEIEEDEHRI